MLGLLPALHSASLLTRYSPLRALSSYLESCVGHAEKGPADCKINLQSPAGWPLKGRVPRVFAERLRIRAMATLSCTGSVSCVPIISSGMHSQRELLPSAPLINCVIGLRQWWDNAPETLPPTRIPLPGFGSIREQNPLWDSSCGAAVPEDLQICVTPTFFKCLGVFFF